MAERKETGEGHFLDHRIKILSYNIGHTYGIKIEWFAKIPEFFLHYFLISRASIYLGKQSPLSYQIFKNKL